MIVAVKQDVDIKKTVVIYIFTQRYKYYQIFLTAR